MQYCKCIAILVPSRGKHSSLLYQKSFARLCKGLSFEKKKSFSDNGYKRESLWMTVSKKIVQRLSYTLSLEHTLLNIQLSLTSLTLSLSLSLSIYLSISQTHTPSLFVSLSLSHTHTCTHSHTHSPHTLTHPLLRQQTLSHTHSLTYSLPPSFSLSLTLSFRFSFFLFSLCFFISGTV